MKFVIAPDSFKNCMTAREAAEAIRSGLAAVFPDAEYKMAPMADGGEGTVQALVDATGGTLRQAEVLDPLQRPVSATYGLLGADIDGIGQDSGSAATAVIEMAAASGIGFVDELTENPLIATTYGTGQLIRAALDDGARRIIIGIGGSATNDGGAGMAEALGVKFLDEHGNAIKRGGGALSQLSVIDTAGLDPRLESTEILIASDVDNPLTGPQGASAVFGPQKGATPAMISQLDASLAHYAAVINSQLGRDVAHMPGSGAAGGLGAGLLAFTNARMQSGVEIVAQTVRLAQRAADADYCITGEGGIDSQTQYGKTPIGVAKAVRQGNPSIVVIALAGYVGSGISPLYNLGIDAIFGIVPGVTTLEQALAEGPRNLARTAENVARLIALSRR
ncbi:glycerate kinase [Bifidobacterium saguini DSM 23967]|uniref:Glycerate kinase n=2 Tax=Bifidobacterium saguini TaxID=762210 RepID=A0A087D9A9_9BIFI|nr:glycerate kinase [Bifidobacterium saguini]KFI92109.1 glycerate kinase [Bifidobacterium saguini DSM 23967]QTB92028.1 glycerate kinase [Bifidobacterium saguini]